MNKVVKHIGYFVTGIFLLLLIHWVVTGAVNLYKKSSIGGKSILIILSIIFIFMVWYANDQQAKADKAYHDNLYGGYDKFQDLNSNSKEIRERDWRREHNCMTSEDFD